MALSSSTYKRKPWQSGIAMFEFLVALFVFSIGLMGYAAIQSQGLRESFDASQRSQAVWRAQEIADRIRSNAADLPSYITQVNSGSICDAAPDPLCADRFDVDEGSAGEKVNAESCTSAEMAEFDAWDVMCNADFGIGSSTIDSSVALTCNDVDTTDASSCSEGSELMLTVEWSSQSVLGDRRIETGGSGDVQFEVQNYTMEFLP